MGEFILNGRNYGGSIITPNPSDMPTDSLDSIKIDDTTYEIQGGGGGGNLIIDAQRYSLDEQVVGIWTDGKPLYQKTVHLSTLPSTANTYTTYSHGIQNIDTICGWDSVARWNTGTIRRIPSTQYVNNSQNITGCFDVNITKTGIEIWVGQNRTALNSDFTIWYTKTTDTAGSGGYQAYGFSPIIYSDTEREVGVWRDNKPLYQKTINIGSLNTAGNSKTYNHSIANIDNIVYQNTIAINTTNGRTIVIPYTDTAVDYNQCISVDKTKVSVWGSVDRSMYNGYVTIQYTKTTDVAGSGEYNTLAIPNVHYSTDEQVIGTWIDGKTLYQRTWQTTAVSGRVVDLSGVNVEKVIYQDAFIMSSDGNNITPHGGGSFVLWNRTATSSASPNNCIMCTINNSNYNNGIMYVTLQYTKTT